MLKSILIFFGLAIVNKALRDNLPDLHHRKVAAAVKTVTQHLLLFILLLLVRAKIIKLSPEVTLSLLVALLLVIGARYILNSGDKRIASLASKK